MNALFHLLAFAQWSSVAIALDYNSVRKGCAGTKAREFASGFFIPLMPPVAAARGQREDAAPKYAPSIHSTPSCRQRRACAVQNHAARVDVQRPSPLSLSLSTGSSTQSVEGRR
jgi:hypothetical protein